MTKMQSGSNFEIPSILLRLAGLRQETGITLTLSHGMVLLTNVNPNISELAAIAESLLQTSNVISPGLYLPAEILLDAEIDPQEELEYTIEEGRILINVGRELLREAWEDYEEDEVLRMMPDEVRHLLVSLGVHPASARDAMVEGGYEF